MAARHPGPQGEAGGSQTFVGLTDTPASFTGESKKIARVNTGETALEVVDFDDIFGGTGATGDIIYRDAAGAWVRLAVGSNDEILTLASGLPSWAAASSGTSTLKQVLSGVISGTLGAVVPDPNSDSIPQDFGVCDSTATDTASRVGWSTDGLYFEGDTNSLINTQAYIVCEASPKYQATGNLMFVYKFSVPTITSIRWLAGFTAASESTTFGADDPADEYAMIQFSTNRSDTKFQYVTRDSGGTQEKTDSGVTMDTSVHYGTIEMTGSSVIFKLYDNAFAQQGSTVTHSTNIPTATTPLQPIVGVRTLAAATRQCRTFHEYIVIGG